MEEKNILFVSSKGGVGKSSNNCGFVTLVSEHLKRGRILATDGDPQANSLLYLEGMIEAGYLPNVDTAYAASPTDLANLPNFESAHKFRTIDLPGYKKADELAAVLEQGELTSRSVDYIVVCLRPNQFDIESVIPWIQSSLIPLELPYGVLLSQVRPAALAEAIDYQRQLSAGGIKCMSSFIRDYAAVSHAQTARRPLTRYGGKHSQARRVEDDMRSMTREILHHVGSSIHIPKLT